MVREANRQYGEVHFLTTAPEWLKKCFALTGRLQEMPEQKPLG
jgi:hypothetical protein